MKTEKNKMSELMLGGDIRVSTISEIKLIRKHLKMQLRQSEERIENEYSYLVSGFLARITRYIIQKGISSIMNFLLRRIFKRR